MPINLLLTRLSRDQEIKHVTIQHDLLLHKTKSKIREHYRRVRRINKKLKKIANLINRLDDRRRIIKVSQGNENSKAMSQIIAIIIVLF